VSGFTNANQRAGRQQKDRVTQAGVQFIFPEAL
jgi:hypothetical protein